MKKISLLVTGASTGIGRAIALDFAREGHQVFASVRKDSDARSLTTENAEITPLVFDVTDGNGIRRGVEAVERLLKLGQPFSLINNAGIAVAGPLEELPMADFRRQFEINVFGALETTQAFFPLVRKDKGRIVNMSSVSGLMTMPFLGAYCSSKFALEALSEALRQELSAEGIKVLLIEPGPIQTPIWDKNFTAARTEVSARYAGAVARFEKLVRKLAVSGLPVERVVVAVRRALLETAPPERQVVTRLQGRLELEIGRRLPSRWLDKIVVSQLFKS